MYKLLELPNCLPEVGVSEVLHERPQFFSAFERQDSGMQQVFLDVVASIRCGNGPNHPHEQADQGAEEDKHHPIPQKDVHLLQVQIV